jgi:MFS family permease
LVRKPPAAPVGGGSAAGAAEPEFSVAGALRTPQFAAIALTHFACCVAHSGPIFHMVTDAIECGVTPMAAATVIGVAGLASVGGRVLCGLLADRFGAKEVLIVGLFVQAVSISLYLFVRDLSAFYALAMVFGLAYGGIMPLYASLVREYFGAAIMGTVFGAVAMISTIGMALGPWAGGWVYDNLGSYFWLYIASCAIGLGAVAIAFAFRPPQSRPHRRRDARSPKGPLEGPTLRYGTMICLVTAWRWFPNCASATAPSRRSSWSPRQLTLRSSAVLRNWVVSKS